jgi:hypothetical protein
MSTIGTTQVFGPELDIRPVCKMIIKNDLIGSKTNSNFADGDTDANPQAFYLTEMPSISLGSDIETNNGAKLSEKLTSFSEMNVLGLSIGEMVQNNATNGGGYVPSLVMGSSSLKIAKSAHKLNLDLKTRIMFDETINSCEHQPYNILLRTLMKLIMPANASKININHLKTAYKNFVNGVGGTAGATAESVKDIDFDAIKDVAEVVKGVAGTWATAGKAFIAEESEMTGIKQDLTKQINALNDKLKPVENILTNMFDNLIKSYIYREYVELVFSRKNQPFNLFQGIISATENKNFQFIVKNFTVTQSNQLYGNTLYPIYMDFDISLESLGVIICRTPISLASS